MGITDDVFTVRLGVSVWQQDFIFVFAAKVGVIVRSAVAVQSDGKTCPEISSVHHATAGELASFCCSHSLLLSQLLSHCSHH